jgi:UDP-N-acetylglucosamine--N-acetylmuramyl-(pentapeptide) pyrophosphoryl-undecaprenol N-acetylglucosamine transferase
MERGAVKRVVIAGGGTGGHVYPGIAIYEALRDRRGRVDVFFVGARGGMEKRILEARGLPYKLIPGRGLRGASLVTKLASPFAVGRSVARAARLIRGFRPDVVIGTGGFASASTVIAAVLTRLPVVLQEQNSVPGLVNRRLARFADLVLLSYEGSGAWLPRGVETAVVGNPLRRMPAVDRAAAADYFGLEAGVPTVLVIGGSRGASSLNGAGVYAALSLEGRGVQFLLLTGERDYDVTRSALSDLAGRVKVMPYLEDVRMAYAIADVAVARAGASSVFELATYGVPTIFVPYPYAADDHQTRNVAALVERGAAMVIRDDELNANALSAALTALLDDDSLRRKMGAELVAWSRPEAAHDAAARIVDTVKKNTAGVEPDKRPPALTAGRRSTLRVVRR